MALSRPTIAKLIRENLPTDMPMQVKTAEKDILQQQIQQALSPIAGVSVTNVENHPHYQYRTIKQEQDYVIFVVVDIKPNTDGLPTNESVYIKPEEVALSISNQQGLFAYLNYHWQPIANLEELKNFAQACRDKFQQQITQKIKRGKQKALKTQAILAHLKKIAKEEQFNFSFETDHVKVKLYVEIAEKEWVMLQIPFKHYQELLPKIQQTLRAILEVRSLGIQFQMNTPPRYSMNYYQYKDL